MIMIMISLMTRGVTVRSVIMVGLCLVHVIFSHVAVSAGFQRPTASAKTSAKAIAARTVKSTCPLCMFLIAMCLINDVGQVLSKEEKDKIKRVYLLYMNR